MIWLIGIAGETVADQQLKKFKSNPVNKGQVCQNGLWNYSRHPNYFFEWLIEILKAAQKHLSHKDHIVAIAAVVAVARQSESVKRAGKALLGVLKREKRTHVVCAALVGMGVVGFEDKNSIKQAKRFFRRNTKETHKAAIRYLGYVKYKAAFRMLAEKLDEPRAKNPNDPNNPPASYWKERWYEWDSNVKYTRWALTQLVEDETFETAEEAKEWVEAEGKKYGVEW